MMMRKAALAALAPMVFAFSAAPAGAALANGADRFGRAPGGSSFAVVAGRPYVAYVRHGGVRVAKLAGSDGTWRKVGGIVRHARSSRSSKPDLIGGPDGHPWITWVDTPKRRDWDPQIRVATFVRGHWRERGKGSRPINGAIFGSQHPTLDRPFPIADNPSLAFYGGRAVVSVAKFDGAGASIRVVQLSRSGLSWNQLKATGDAFFDVGRPFLATAGGRLFAGGTCCFSEGHDHFAKFARLNSSGKGWQELGDLEPGFDDTQPFLAWGVADVNGLFTVLWTGTTSDRAGILVSSLGADDQWVDVGPPLAQSGTPLALAADRGVAYAAYRTVDSSDSDVQVRRLVGGQWETLTPPADPGVDGVSARFAPARGGGMWLLSGERVGGRIRYALDGYGVAAPAQLPK
jgi:hypothetical protein